MSIGIFDSGVGGLTVLRAISEKFPQANIIYLGDTARFPYGTKTTATVQRFAIDNTQFLIDQGAQTVVVACNTATATALSTLRQKFSIPIIGVIDGAVQEALQLSKTGRIGVIATNRTIKLKSYQKALLQKRQSVEVFAYPCPLLVAAIEDGRLPDPLLQSIVAHYLQPFKEQQIDTLILGCTHFPLVRAQIEAYLGPGVTVIDPAQSCMRDLPHPPPSQEADYRFFVSDDADRFKKVGRLFLGRNLQKFLHSVQCRG
jgi:glutamate racemase